jgi:HD-GYP domain-containing protein (c-di-GMP phosphodiesterase class II)
MNFLQKLGIQSLYIKDEITGDLSTPEIISEKTRVDTIKIIRQTFTQYQAAQSLNLSAIKTAIDKILDEVLSHSNTLIHAVDIRTNEDYPFAHSVNVCILSLMTGISLSFNTLQLKELGIGALLHDIGKTTVPNELLHKPGKLTDAEFKKIQEHPFRGLEILRQFRDIALSSSNIAYQHHERIDGTGYPLGLKGDEIHEYSRIVAITDVYDALLADRVYRPSFPPFEAMRHITRGTYTLFDPRTAAAFMENIAIYPIGSMVQLNNGDVGIVVDINKQSQLRPIIRILLEGPEKNFTKDKEIDLDKFPALFIVDGYNEESSYSILNDLEIGRRPLQKNSSV